MTAFHKFITLVVFIVLLDQITKWIAVKFIGVGNITIIPNILDLTIVWNKGAAFGVLAQAPEYIRKLILIGASSIAAVATIFYAYKKASQLSKLELYSLALIAGGAIGNLYDRIILGSVRDFIDFHIGKYHWPAFNIADAAITIGIIGFVVSELFLKKKR
ncbi:MAG: signal peptidase II [Aquificae bacterium]|nr:signal peptidase II [Aquificota bacterium]